MGEIQFQPRDRSLLRDLFESGVMTAAPAAARRSSATSNVGEYADSEKYPFPSLVLLDLKMPRMNGFEVLEWKRNQPELDALPVVIWSSSDLAADRERAHRLGATSYFVKPMEAEGFIEIIEHLKWFYEHRPRTLNIRPAS